jgi:hypothetical protein
MRKTTLLLATSMMVQSLTAFGLDLRNQKHPLISTAETKLEQRNYKAQKDIEKERERLAREEWKKLSDHEKAQNPWTTWYRKKIVPALLELAKTRKALYRDNLFDSYVVRPSEKGLICSNFDKKHRRIDGKCNDLSDKLMGAVWTRFARNIDHKESYTDEKTLFYPNPRVISKELLTRDTFKEVPFLNLMAVAWIQFMVHDWFSHGENENPEVAAPYYIPLEKGDVLGEEMMIPRSMVDRTRTSRDNKIPARTYLNEVTHWWDASQVYGSSHKAVSTLRTFKDGLLKVNNDGFLPRHEVGLTDIGFVRKGIEKTGFNRNWWLGLNMLHTLFTLEHNAIAKELKAKHPKMNDEELFNKAKMINAALIAKIHTIEWTPAILPNRTLRVAMGANWKGALNGSHQVKPWYELIDQEVLFGLVGGKKDLSGRPFHFTEEFVSVYRMHPLLPDNIVMRDIKNGKVKESLRLNDVREQKAGDVIRKHGMLDAFYSFGQMKPGQLVLNNFPTELMNISIPFSGKIDLGTIDIFRDRERGVPRYNDFRRQLKMKPIKTFDDLTEDKAVVAKLKKIYNNDVEMLDLMIGCLAEGHRPVGYGFGETAFQVFVIMASRRLVSDRFYTTSYNAETYTAEGIKWVDDNSMKTILLRHMPALKHSLFGIRNAFNPWNAAGTKVSTKK